MFELLVGFGEEGFLVFFLVEGEEGVGMVVLGEEGVGDFGFLGGEKGYVVLVLVEVVVLEFEVVDCFVGEG